MDQMVVYKEANGERKETEGDLLHGRNFVYPVADLRFVGLAPRESREVRQELENLPAGRGRGPGRLPPLELGRRGGCDGDAVGSPQVASPAMGGESKGFQEVLSARAARSAWAIGGGEAVRMRDCRHRNGAGLRAVALQKGQVAVGPRERRGAGGKLGRRDQAVLTAHV